MHIHRKERLWNECFDTDASVIIADFRNDGDLLVSENQNKSVVEDDRKSIEHAYVIDNGSRSGSCSDKKTLTVALL